MKILAFLLGVLVGAILVSFYAQSQIQNIVNKAVWEERAKVCPRWLQDLPQKGCEDAYRK